VSGANEQILDESLTAAMLTQPIDWMESGVVPSKQVCSIQYLDLVESSLQTIETVYAHFGIALSAEARSRMDAYLRANPRVKRPAHRYKQEKDQGGKAVQLFDRYRRYFSVKSED
jgi:hypothetical protein